MATPESIKENIKIGEFYKALNYPDLETFVSFHKDKVKKDRYGILYVLKGVDYKPYSEVSETVTEEGSDEQLSAQLQADQGGAEVGLTDPDAEVKTQIEAVISEKGSSTTPSLSSDSPEAIAARNLLDSGEPAHSAELEQTEVVTETPKVPLTAEMAFKDGEFQVDAPAGMVKTTDVQKQVTEKDQDLTKISNLLGQQRAINQELAQFGIDIEEKETAASLQAIQQMQEQEEDYRLAREERVKLQKQREQQLMNQVTAATNEYKSARVDPERFFNKKGTGAKILAALAAGLGAYAAAMTGTRNFALEVIDQAISDDIEAQKVEIAQKGEVITERRNLLNDLINQGMTDAEAESAARVIMLNKIQLDLDQKVALTKNEAVKQKGEILKKQLQTEADLAIERLKLDAAPTKVTITTEKMVKDPTLSATSLESIAKKEKVKALAKRQVDEELGLTAKEKKALSVPGFLGTAPSDKEAIEARDAVKKIREAEITIDELIAARTEHGFEPDFGVFTNKEREAAKTKTILFLGMIKNKLFLDLGVLQAADVELLNRALPSDPLGGSPLKDAAIKRQYEEVKKYIKQAGELYFDSLTLTPETGIRPDFSRADMRSQFKASQATYE